MILTRWTQLSLRTLALTYLGILVALPIGLILVRTFGDGSARSGRRSPRPPRSPHCR